MALTVSRSPTAPTALTLSSKNNPSLRYLYLNQRRYYFVWLYKVLEIYIFITLWIPVLYHNNHPYYPNRNQGIELFVVSIIIIVTGIYDSRWRVFSRPRLPAIARKYMVLRAGSRASEQCTRQWPHSATWLHQVPQRKRYYSFGISDIRNVIVEEA